MNMAEPHILRLQATQRVKGIFRASPDQRLTTAHPGASYAEVPEEKLVASRPLFKAVVEFTKLPGECITEILFVACNFSFPGIREDCDSSLTQLNELRLGAEVYRVLPFSPAKHIQIAFQLRSMISRYQNHGGVIGHFDQSVDPEVPFLNRGLIRREVAIDYKEVNACPDGICDKPFQALSGIREVAAFVEMKITGVTES
jgi:hypothetical protein